MELCPQERVSHRAKFGTPPPAALQRAVPSFLLAPTPVVAPEEPSPPPEAPLAAAPVEPGDPAGPADTRGTRPAIDDAPAQDLPSLWRQFADRLARLLGSMPSPDAPRALDEAARDLGALAARAPDLALFMLVRADYAEHLRVGVVRALQAATAALLVGRHAGWPEERRMTFVKAAFTMNLGMLELQERLSNQARLPDPTQRRAIHAHPLTSVKTLEDSGVADAEWLEAVAQHHEQPKGGGYPAGLLRVAEMGNALRVIDVYTAKLAGRSGRDALPPERALRDLLIVERGNPFALALSAEFGRHPPGSLVRLHSGEVGVVVRRDAEHGTPRVAVLMGRRGEPLATPILREAAGREHGIAGDVEARSLRARVSPEQLYGEAAA